MINTTGVPPVNNPTYAVATASTVFRPSGGFAAQRTTERNVNFLAAAACPEPVEACPELVEACPEPVEGGGAKNAPCGASNHATAYLVSITRGTPSFAGGRIEGVQTLRNHISLVFGGFAAKHQRKRTSSTLPQAENL
jgi:hypothetical protein